MNRDESSDRLDGVRFSVSTNPDPGRVADNLNRMAEQMRRGNRFMETTIAGPPRGAEAPNDFGTPRWNYYFPAVSFKNVGAAGAAHLAPLIHDRANHATGLTGGAFALRLPDVDWPPFAYVNISEETTAVNGFGLAVPMISGPYYVEVDEAVETGDIVGANGGDVTFMHHIPGYRVMAYHAVGADHFASVYRDEGPVRLKRIAGPAANKYEVQSLRQDGTASGVSFDVYEPD